MMVTKSNLPSVPYCARIVVPKSLISALTTLMRFDLVVHIQTRYTTREVELHGSVTPARSMVRLYLGVGNRDECVFEDLDTFNLHWPDLHLGHGNRSGRYRSRLPGHLGFGVGQHFCMGYMMVRQKAITASVRMLEMMGDPRPKLASHPEISSPSIDSGGFRSP